MAAHMKTEDGLLVMNLWANDEDHKNFGLKIGGPSGLKGSPGHG